MYGGVWRTLNPDLVNVRVWMGGEVWLGRWGITRRRVDGGRRAVNFDHVSGL